MGIIQTIKSGLKEAFACINHGGQPLSPEWKSDEALRVIVENRNAKNGGPVIEGDLFLDDMKEFYDAMETFNATRPPEMRFRVMLHEDVAEKLPTAVQADRRSLLGLGAVEGIALERHGRIYKGRWFSDMVESSGFAFTMQGRETKFLCGLERKTDFKTFALRMLNPPPHYPTPQIPRYI